MMIHIRRVEHVFVVVFPIYADGCWAGNRNDHSFILTIVLWGDGFENSNKFCVVAHFYSETLLVVPCTFSSDRNSRLLCRHGVESWRVWGKLRYRALGGFAWLLVENADRTARAAGSHVKFGRSWLHTKAGSSRGKAVHRMAFCLRKWVDNSDLQGQYQALRKTENDLHSAIVLHMFMVSHLFWRGRVMQSILIHTDG